MGGVVCREELDAEVVYSEGEGGGHGCVCPKAVGVCYRDVALGLEVEDEALVSDDASFFQPTHALLDFDVDISSRVGEG